MRPLRFRPSTRRSVLLICLASVVAITAQSQQADLGRSIPTKPLIALPDSLREDCAGKTAGLNRQSGVDSYADMVASLPRYRLVIGTDSFKDPEVQKASGRPFVRDTAVLIDSRLDAVGYKPLPSRAGKNPYLVGPDATKQAIKDALKDMALRTLNGGTGIVYYIGHGALADSHFDVTYSVYDRPVENDEGIRFSDIVGQLTVDEYQDPKKQIPRFILVFDTCYSGSVIPIERTQVVDRNGTQVMTRIQSGFVIPDNVAVLTASSPGEDGLAYPLNGTNLSAYSAVFAATLADEWDCANLEHDGLLTVFQMHMFVSGKLMKAPTTLIDNKMTASMVGRGDDVLAYSPDHWYEYGKRIYYKFTVEPIGGVVALRVNSNTPEFCPPDCSLFATKNDNISVSRHILALTGEDGEFEDRTSKITPRRSTKATISVERLLSLKTTTLTTAKISVNE